MRMGAWRVLLDRSPNSRLCSPGQDGIVEPSLPMLPPPAAPFRLLPGDPFLTKPGHGGEGGGSKAGQDVANPASGTLPDTAPAPCPARCPAMMGGHSSAPGSQRCSFLTKAKGVLPSSSPLSSFSSLLWVRAGGGRQHLRIRCAQFCSVPQTGPASMQ